MRLQERLERRGAEAHRAACGGTECAAGDRRVTTGDEEELAALVRFLRRARSFRLAFAIVDDDSRRDELMARAAEWAGVAPVLVRLDPAVPPAVQLARSTGDGPRFVIGLDGACGVDDAHSPALANLNLNRDAIRRSVPAAVVFFGPEPPVATLAVRAPDLWSGHADVFRFAAAPDRDQAMVPELG